MPKILHALEVFVSIYKTYVPPTQFGIKTILPEILDSERLYRV